MTYSSSVALNRRRLIRRNQNTVAAAVSAKTLGPVSNTIVLVVLTCLIFLLYLTQVTRTNDLGSTISGIKDSQSSLQKARDNLEVESARLQSIQRVKNSTVAKSMVNTSPSGSIR